MPQCGGPSDMKCLILAAGYATRLYPLTENFPKPLLDVQGKTILDWLVEDISPFADGFIVVTNHKFAPHFKQWAEKRREDIAVVDDGTLTNETRLGAVKDIEFALAARSVEDDVLVIAGDNLLDFSLAEFIGYSANKGTSCVMRYYETDEKRLHRCGILCINDEDRITDMEEKPEKPKSHWACPPFYYYRKNDLSKIGEGIADGCGTDAPGSFVAWLSARAPVHAMIMPGKRYDIGTLESYREVQKSFRPPVKI